MTAQLDLFDFIDGETRGTGAQDQLRFASVLTCMRDAMPNTMRFMIDLWAPQDRAWHGSGEWSYWWTAAKIVAYPRRRGEEEQSITWEEFTELVEHHPARQAILDWENSLDMPKWRDLARPEELSPYAGDHGSDFGFDRNRPGWDERLKAWKTLQSILTDAICAAAPDWESFRLPQQEWQRPRGSCRFCREEVIVGSYAEGLNHSPSYAAGFSRTMCVRQSLVRNQAYAAYQQVEAAKRDPDAKCLQCQNSRKPCPQDHFDANYERAAARATEAWHGDGWKGPAA